MTEANDRPRSVPQILDTAMRLYLGRFGLLFAIAAGSGVVTLLVSLGGPAPVPTFFAGSLPGVTSVGQFGAGTTWWAALVAGVVGALATSAIMVAADSAMRHTAGGTPADVGTALRMGLGRLWPYIVTLVTVALAAAAGFALLIVPGLFLGTRWALAPVAAVVEKRRASRALGRSFALVRGLFWHVFGAVVLAFVASAIVGAVLRLPALIPASGQLAGVVQSLWSTAAAAAVLPYQYCVLVVLFHDVRARKEGTDLVYDGAA